jgi:hypothetical protein
MRCRTGTADEMTYPCWRSATVAAESRVAKKLDADCILAETLAELIRRESFITLLL